MKKISVVVLLLINFSAYAQFFHPWKVLDSAGVIVTYSLHWQQDSTDAERIRSEDMQLFFGDSLSKFQSKNSYRFDTIIQKMKTVDEFIAMTQDQANAPPMTGILYKIYKNLPKSKITITAHTLDGTFKFTEPLDLMQWQLTAEADTLCGYRVQKATTNFGGRKWIAWFTPELPYNDGPYKFCGLPGLILKVHDSRNHYVFELKSIERLAEPLAIKMEEKDYIESTKMQYFKALDAMYADIISRAKEAGLSSSSQQTAARNLKRRNNPIELIRK